MLNIRRAIAFRGSAAWSDAEKPQTLRVGSELLERHNCVLIVLDGDFFFVNRLSFGRNHLQLILASLQHLPLKRIVIFAHVAHEVVIQEHADEL